MDSFGTIDRGDSRHRIIVKSIQENKVEFCSRADGWTKHRDDLRRHEIPKELYNPDTEPLTLPASRLAKIRAKRTEFPDTGYDGSNDILGLGDEDMNGDAPQNHEEPTTPAPFTVAKTSRIPVSISRGRQSATHITTSTTTSSNIVGSFRGSVATDTILTAHTPATTTSVQPTRNAWLRSLDSIEAAYRQEASYTRKGYARARRVMFDGVTLPPFEDVLVLYPYNPHPTNSKKFDCWLNSDVMATMAEIYLQGTDIPSNTIVVYDPDVLSRHLFEANDLTGIVTWNPVEKTKKMLQDANDFPFSNTLKAHPHATRLLLFCNEDNHHWFVVEYALEGREGTVRVYDSLVPGLTRQYLVTLAHLTAMDDSTHWFARCWNENVVYMPTARLGSVDDAGAFSIEALTLAIHGTEPRMPVRPREKLRLGRRIRLRLLQKIHQMSVGTPIDNATIREAIALDPPPISPPVTQVTSAVQSCLPARSTIVPTLTTIRRTLAYVPVATPSSRTSIARPDLVMPRHSGLIVNEKGKAAKRVHFAKSLAMEGPVHRDPNSSSHLPSDAIAQTSPAPRSRSTPCPMPKPQTRQATRCSTPRPQTRRENVDRSAAVEQSDHGKLIALLQQSIGDLGDALRRARPGQGQRMRKIMTALKETVTTLEQVMLDGTIVRKAASGGLTYLPPTEFDSKALQAQVKELLDRAGKQIV